MTVNDRQEPAVAAEQPLVLGQDGPDTLDRLLAAALLLKRQMAAVMEALDVTEAAYGEHAKKDNQRGAFAHGRVSLAHDLRGVIERASAKVDAALAPAGDRR